MANLISNATFLDGPTGWSQSGGGTPVADEEDYGSTGRIALNASGATSSPENFLGADVTLPEDISRFEASAGWLAPGAQLAVVWFDEGDVEIGRVVVPQIRAAQAAVRPRGLPPLFNHSRGLVDAPAGAVRANLRLTRSAATGAWSFWLLKPMLAPMGTVKNRWQPGPHDNPDLNLPSWPTDLPGIREGAQFPPVPTRRSYEGDQGVPVTTRSTTVQRFKMKAELQLDMIQRDQLDEFFKGSQGPFWYTRPDTMQVCQATWLADGEPSDTAIVNGNRTTQFGLFLKVV